MSVGIENCCDCGTMLSCFTVSRLIGGFAEYVITHATDNPITYFVGRRYSQAQYTYTLTNTSSGTCSGSAMADGGHDYTNAYTFTLTSSYSAFTNIQTGSATGTHLDGTAMTGGFLEDGYYGYYANTFGLVGPTGPGEFPPIDAAGSPIDPFYPGALDCKDYASMWWNFFFSASGCPAGGPFFDYTSDGCNGGALSSTCNPSDSGSVTSASGSITSTTYSGSAAQDCTHNDCKLSVTTCVAGFTFIFNWSASASAVLSSEVNYTAVFASIKSASDSIKASYPGNGAALSDCFPTRTGFAACSSLCYTFNDWNIAGASADGSVLTDVGQSFVPGTTDFYCCGNNACGTDPGPDVSVTRPMFQTVAYAVTFVAITGSDTPGDSVDFTVWGVEFNGQANVGSTGNYVLATYIVMNDYSLVQDTFGGPTPAFCQDMTGTGVIWIPQPSIAGFDATLFTTGGGGALIGPIGRIAVIIPDMTCALWDETTPT